MKTSAVVLAALVVLGSAAPAVADPGTADLAVTVSVDRPSYRVFDELTAVVVVTNTGTAPATGVRVRPDTSYMLFPGEQWGALDQTGPGAVLAPGERLEVRLTSTIDDPDRVQTVGLDVWTEATETDLSDNRAVAEFTVDAAPSDVTGILYGDRDADGVIDPGEVLTGVRVWAPAIPAFDTRTDAEGRFAARGVPEGRYALEVGLPAGWRVDGPLVFEVRDGAHAVLRALRDASALRASIEFDRRTYAVGDTVRETVRITNPSDTDVPGVTARCVEGAGPNTLSGLGWGDLVHDVAPGITVRAGETVVFGFSDVVRPGGRLYGFITITCWFGNGFRYDEGPAVVARAEVPGGRGGITGWLFTDRDEDLVVDPGEGVAGLKVFLVADDGTIVARTVTDAGGGFAFLDVAANNYALRLAGPWRIRDAADPRVGIFADDTIANWLFPVVAGPRQPDLDAPPPGPSTVPVTPVDEPAPQAAPKRPANLADTGAEVREMAALGVLLLLAGAALVFVRRRREDA